MSNILQDDIFYYCEEKNFRGIECRVSLSQFNLTITETGSGNKKRTINVDDVIGCLCMRNQDPNEGSRNPEQDTVSVFLCVYFYSLSKTDFKKSPYRKRETALLRCRKYPAFVENCDHVAKWQSLLYSLIQSNQIYPHMSVTTPNIAESRRLLVFVNPNSGPGVALKTFNTRIRSFLGEANISYDLIVTTHVGHCQQIIQDSKDLSKYTGIVAVSGDGLLYEIFNGLFAREDWDTMCEIPVGAIPQGSGNGLARSLAHFNNEPYLHDPLVVSVLNVVKLKSREMDLCLINTTNFPKLISFLSVGWGLMADIDIESERLRMIGEARFTVGALARVMRLRTYKATIFYLPVNEDTPSEEMPPLPPLDEPLPDQRWVTMSGEFVCVYSSMVPFIGTDLFFAPKSVLNDGIIWLMIVKAPISKFQVTQLLLSMDKGTHIQLPWVTFVPVTAFRLIPDKSVGPQSYLVIDGEKLDTQAMQAQIIPRKGRIFMR
ncbi:sphingosine kinase 2-like isoform X2 [Daphnia pulicaria]|uniref:sphingosine kinase 2-like isoform X2 n=1 Tax=Daphnia pulicaria TaxID=35523 RepID=UPI001EECDBBD|nr:sphingosine kinase 2-like isoform X2 [Daphnia pulicaria]